MKIIYGVICGILMSCASFVEVEEAGSIMMKNNSSYGIFVMTCLTYPDTTIEGCINSYFRMGMGLDDRTHKQIDTMDRESWDIYFKEHEKVIIFVLGSYKVENLKESDILKKFIIGKTELDSVGWVLNYP